MKLLVLYGCKLCSDTSHTLQCQSKFNIVYIAVNHDLSLALLINEGMCIDDIAFKLEMYILVSVAQLVLLEHNIVIYQRQIGRNVRCAAFSTNGKYV